MSAGYVIAKENFKEAAKHVSPDTEPVMFNLLCGLQSLTDQIEADFVAMRAVPTSAAKPAARKAAAKRPVAKAPAKKAKKAAKKPARRSR